MIFLRIGLAIVVVLQAFSSFFPLLGNVLYKSGLAPVVSGPAARMVPLWAATPWWQLAVWLAAILMLVAAAWRLIRRRPALWLYIAGIAANAGLRWIMQAGPAYRQVFGETFQGFNYARLAILVLVGALIWWVEQQPAKAAPAPSPANSKGPA
jgi:hypothetical protein